MDLLGFPGRELWFRSVHFSIDACGVVCNLSCFGIARGEKVSGGQGPSCACLWMRLFLG